MLYFAGAHDKNFGMGYQGHLPWPRMGADIERFHTLTKDKSIVMGQRTYEEYKRVKHAFNIHKAYVLSNSLNSLADAEVVHSLEDIVEPSKQKDIWVIGGGSLFAQLIAHVDVMYLTKIEAEFKVDTYFPEYTLDDWNIARQETFPADSENPYPYTFLELKKT